MTRGHSKSLARSAELTSLAERRWGPKRKWRCVYCGRGAGMVVDHFKATVDGGTDDIWNLVPACSRCNTAKMDKPAWAWMTAVGVPASRIVKLMQVTRLSDWVAPPGLQITRVELDYLAGGQVPRPKRPSEGK